MHMKVQLGEAPRYPTTVIAMEHHPTSVRRNNSATAANVDGDTVSLEDKAKICLTTGKP
jgi:hypothetical protein